MVPWNIHYFDQYVYPRIEDRRSFVTNREEGFPHRRSLVVKSSADEGNNAPKTFANKELAFHDYRTFEFTVKAKEAYSIH